MGNPKKNAATVGIAGNIFLFIAKLAIGFVSNSIAIISDAFNSLTDVVNSIILFFSVKVGSKSADEDHPFGHHRSEPLGGLIVAVLTIVLGFEIARIAATRLITKTAPIFSIPVVFILLLTILIKSFMYLYTRSAWKKTKSTAVFVLMVDHRNDIWISSGAIIGFLGANYNIVFLDALVAFFIGIWIIKVGFSIGARNVKYLMGEAPKPELVDKISRIVLNVNGVRSIQKIKAHYVGVLLQVEVHIRVSRNISVYRAHTIETNARKAIEKLREVDRAFVHVDPIIKSRPH
ncbi:cation transporter [Candidatus Woesearchaeota archaeon]|nr:cation transporter [Candidatus Woesearchaeota archaeon]